MDGSVKKAPTESGLKNRISRDGMPVVTKMKDGTYVLVFEGTYRDLDYPELTGNFLGHHKWFEILLSYSKDGMNWSNPIEIYISKYNGTKSSAPFILCNDNNQLIVSFQTDVDYYRYGLKGFMEMIANYGSIIKSKHCEETIDYLIITHLIIQRKYYL